MVSENLPNPLRPSATEAASNSHEIGTVTRDDSTGSRAGPRDWQYALPSTIGCYQILGELGRGGMGIVYRAHDAKRGLPVALKILPRLDPMALSHFKNEFRFLARVAHRNLAAIYELIAEGEQWYIAMELVEGINFLAYVRAGPAGGEADLTTEFVPSAGEEAEIRPTAAPQAGLARESLVRLRAAIRQLAEGVQALHDASRLHRDIKPSNILVTPSGRVVLLDFGLAAELEPTRTRSQGEGAIVGTIAYMAPEQAADQPLSPACDWYSVGAVLYEALTGRQPFKGSAARVLQDKQELDPPPPAELVANIPADLNLLCAALLNRRPEKRPSGQEVLRLLCLKPGVEPAGTTGAVAAARVPFVGRDRHFRLLVEAYRHLQGGRAITVCVHGRSGVGKSALVQQFLDDLTVEDDAVILTGRCYENESVPYKALDGLMDALGRHLRRLSEPERTALLPKDFRPLARVFPVLRGLDADGESGPSGATTDLQELRRRAFAGLRELLARLGRKQPLVLAIDDLQWGDEDGAAFLTELLRPPNAPRLLFLASYRSEEVGSSSFLRAFLANTVPSPDGSDRRELAVEPLLPGETQELVLRLLGRDDPAARTWADAVVRESGGNPYFIAELVRNLQAVDSAAESTAPAAALSLDDVLWERIERLPEEARWLLEAAAVAGRPLRQADVCAAIHLTGDERPALAVLCAGQLLRVSGPGARDDLETYHDRVRETVLAHLTPLGRAAHHTELARVLEVGGETEAEILAVHFQGAGSLAKAGAYYARAAAQAAETLAFDHAAKLYRLALDLGGIDDGEARRLRTELGNALANAGRGEEAAQAYLAAAANLAPTEALDLRRRAVQQRLISGRVDEGLPLLRTLLDGVGLPLAATPRKAIWSLLYHRVLLWFRGLRFRERPAAQIPAHDLARLDIGWAASLGLSMTDNTRAADIQTRHLLDALRVGEPFRIARALAMEVPHTAARAGPRAKRRAADLARLAEEIAGRQTDPYLFALITTVRGVAAYADERWRLGVQLSDRGEQLLRDSCAGAAFERTTAHTFALWCLLQLGEGSEVGRRCPALFHEAQARGDLYAVTNLLSFTPLVHLMADNPDGARQDIHQALTQWTRQGYHIQHYALLQAQVAVELYTGNGLAALECVSRQWPAFAGSFLKRIQMFHIQVIQLHAYSALAAAATVRQSEPYLRTAATLGRRLRGEKTAWSSATACYIQGAVAVARGDQAGGQALLETAVKRFEAADMRLHVAAVRRRLGELIGGDEGRVLVVEADAVIAGQNIKNPAAMTAVYAPGFPSLLLHTLKS